MRGRPPDQAKKEQIFTTAIDLFARYGYEGTSMDKIAEASSVSKQTVYNHFGSKDELFQASIDRLCKAMGLGPELSDDKRPVEKVLLEVGAGFLTVLTSREAVRLYRLILGTVSQYPAVGRIFYKTGPQTFIAHLAHFLEVRSKAGELNVVDSKLAAAQFFSLIRGELHMRVALDVRPRPSDPEMESYVKSCVQLFVRGYAPA